MKGIHLHLTINPCSNATLNQARRPKSISLKHRPRNLQQQYTATTNRPLSRNGLVLSQYIVSPSLDARSGFGAEIYNSAVVH